MRVIFLLSLAILLMTSCEKDEDSEDVVTVPVLTPKLTHMPLDIGNYWVYQTTRVDIDGVETITNDIDSVIITRDTIISDNQYFIFEGKEGFGPSTAGFILRMMRDSLGYLVDSKGNIYYSETISTDTLHSRLQNNSEGLAYRIDYIMENYEGFFNVPAGNFVYVLNMKGTVISYLENTEELGPMIQNHYYAKDVEPLYYNYFYLYSRVEIRKKLLRYYIVPENITN